MPTSVLVLGAGFGGLEASSRLSDALGDDVEVTLIDRADAFVFGFSKLDLMFGRARPDQVRLEYADIVKPRVRFVREAITAIDPAARRVTTAGGDYQADVVIVALGADYDVAATPGLAEHGHDFYSVEGARALRNVLPAIKGGSVVVGVCGTPFKCPPAPSETVLLLDEYLRDRGVRDRVDISLVIPFGTPVPPSPETSDALLARFGDRGISFVGDRRVVERTADEVVLDDGRRLPCDVFLGIPVHRVPRVVEASGLAVDGWVPVDPSTLATRFANVFAVGDVTSVGTAKAGVFAEGAARVVAEQLVARLRGEPEPPGYDGIATCYVEFGGREVARVDVDFFTTPGHPEGTFHAPSKEIAADKVTFASDRRARWLGV